MADRAAGQTVCTRLMVSRARLPRTRVCPRGHVPVLCLLEHCGDRRRRRRVPWKGSDRAEGGDENVRHRGGGCLYLHGGAPTAPLPTTRIYTRGASRAAWTTTCLEVSGVWGDDEPEYGGRGTGVHGHSGRYALQQRRGRCRRVGRVRGGGHEGGRRGQENVREIQPVALWGVGSDREPRT